MGGNVELGEDGKEAGVILLKDMRPHTFSDNHEDRRTWQDDVKDYRDTSKQGMRDLMIEIANSHQPIDDFRMWVDQEILMLHQLGAAGLASLRSKSHNLWRALKVLTDTTSEAREVIMGVDRENGLGAWQRLHQSFGEALVAKQGLVKVLRMLSI